MCFQSLTNHSPLFSSSSLSIKSCVGVINGAMGSDRKGRRAFVHRAEGPLYRFAPARNLRFSFAPMGVSGGGVGGAFGTG